MWVPIALGRDVPVGVTRAVVLEGRELVVWRGEAGSAQVWEDRCPHRGMRLSFGFVRGDSLNCLYHGWEYGAGAGCRRIPAHPDLEVPNTIRTTAFAAAETAGLIWTNMGAVAPVPAVPDAGPVASLAIDAASDAILALCAAAPRGDAQIFAADIDGITFQIGWHDVAGHKTMLHATLSGSADPVAALHALRGLRDRAERKVAA